MCGPGSLSRLGRRGLCDGGVAAFAHSPTSILPFRSTRSAHPAPFELAETRADQGLRSHPRNHHSPPPAPAVLARRTTVPEIAAESTRARPAFAADRDIRV